MADRPGLHNNPGAVGLIMVCQLGNCRETAVTSTVCYRWTMQNSVIDVRVMSSILNMMSCLAEPGNKLINDFFLKDRKAEKRAQSNFQRRARRSSI